MERVQGDDRGGSRKHSHGGHEIPIIIQSPSSSTVVATLSERSRDRDCASFSRPEI